jgi:ribose 5-phosphate isomerase B
MNKDTIDKPLAELTGTLYCIGIAADHGGYELKEYLARMLREAGHKVIGFGDQQPKLDDDYPDFVVPLARAVACGEVERGVAICGSGVGASVCANKVAGVRASLIHESFSAHQGVELVQGFLAARFSGAERHRRRLAKVAALESKPPNKTS